jgi:hypothetical protein
MRGGVDPPATWEAETTPAGLIISRAKVWFADMQRVWQLQKLEGEITMQWFRGCVLPVLSFGSKTWAVTNQQSGSAVGGGALELPEANPTCVPC